MFHQYTEYTDLIGTQVDQPVYLTLFNCWFGFLGSPKNERDCYLKVPDSNPKPPDPKPAINQLVEPNALSNPTTDFETHAIFPYS